MKKSEAFKRAIIACDSAMDLNLDEDFEVLRVLYEEYAIALSCEEAEEGSVG